MSTTQSFLVQFQPLAEDLLLQLLHNPLQPFLFCLIIQKLPSHGTLQIWYLLSPSPPHHRPAPNSLHHSSTFHNVHFACIIHEVGASTLPCLVRLASLNSVSHDWKLHTPQRFFISSSEATNPVDTPNLQQVRRLKGGVATFRVQGFCFTFFPFFLVFFFHFFWFFLFLASCAQNLIFLASVAARFLVNFLLKKNHFFLSRLGWYLYGPSFWSGVAQITTTTVQTSQI